MAPLSGAAAASRCALHRPSSLQQAGPPPLRPARRQQRPARRPSAAPAPESSVTGTAEAQTSLLSEAEKFVLEMSEAEEEAAAPPAAGQPAQLQGQLVALRSQVAELSAKIDALYSTVLVGVALPLPAEGDDAGAAASAALAAELAAVLPDSAALTEARFGELGRSSPKVGAAAVG